MGEPMALSNGSWGPTSMSIPFILSPEESTAARPSQMLSREGSTAGVLTRTMVRSPVVKWILPARIRHKDRNDVIFVGTSSIELKEFSRRHDLHTVATKTDFDSEIRAARIFGETRKPSSAYLDFDSDNMGSEDPDMMPMELDSQSPPDVPPQMLVLSLQNGNSDCLVFLFAHHDRYHGVRFISSTRPLPGDCQQACRLGAQIAVDPRSRAMAVAAQAGKLVIYTLKSRSSMHQEIDWSAKSPGESFRPVKQERQLDVNGAILKMEFLHPPKDAAHQSTVVLALLIRPFGRSNTGTTYLRYFDWNCTLNLWDVEFDWQRGLPLPNKEDSPSLLIPLTICPGVLLACRDRMYIWRDLLSGDGQPLEIEYESSFDEQKGSADPVEPGGSRGLPLCTAWARATRHSEYAATTDTLYICREDGAVIFYELTIDGTPTEHFAGKLNVNVDSAFACLDLGVGDPGKEIDRGSFDVLVIVGNMSDGGLFEFKSREPTLPRFQRVPNWAPTLDYAVVFPPNGKDQTVSRDSPAPCSIKNKDRIFSCADRGVRHGTVSEMRFGAEAQTSFEIRLKELGVSVPDSVIGVWIFPESDTNPVYNPYPDLKAIAHKQDHAIICITYPEETERFTLSGIGEVVKNASDSYTEALIDISQRTIVASTTANNLAIQITPTSLRAIGIPSTSRPQTTLLEHKFDHAYVLQASVDGRHSSCLLSQRLSTGTVIQLLHLSISGDDISLTHQDSKPSPVPAETSCVFITSFASGTFGIVGTIEGKLYVYKCSHSSLFPLCEYTFKGDTAICESICLIKKPREGSLALDPIVLCGLRNGTVHVLLLTKANTGHYNLHYCEKLDIELETVSVFPENGSQTPDDELPYRAIIVSRDCFCRVFYRNARAAEITMQCIWITHPEYRGIQPAEITCMAQYTLWDRLSSAFSRSRMFCLSKESARLIHLGGDTESIAVPRKMHIDGTPTRVTYVSKVKKLAVAFEHVVVPERDLSAGMELRSSDRRLVFPAVQLLDPDTYEAEYVDNIKVENGQYGLFPDFKIIGRSGEKIMAISEWLPSLKGKTWALLIVSTLRVRKNGAQEEGSIYIYSLPRTNGEVKISQQKEIHQDKPVYSLAPLGQSSLVFCTGTNLVVLQLAVGDEDKLKFHQVAKRSLMSSARHLSVHGNDIYASTAEHSVVMFTLEGQNLVEKLNDREGRRSLHNVVVPERSMVVASDLASTVRGLHKPPHEPVDASFQPVFEVVLPVSISRLRIASLNPRRGSSGNTDQQEIIGSGFDGAFYSFSFLSLKEWRLLSFIQNMARKKSSICPYTYRNYTDSRIDPEEGLRNMNVDGDVLARIFTCGDIIAADFLKDLVATTPSEEFEHSSVEYRQKKFVELAKAAISDPNEQDAYEAVVCYLRSMLQIDI